MHVLILGSGVIGTTLAYVLTQQGHEVTVIDRQPASARECSFANGGQLSYSHAEPWASPYMLKRIIRWLGKKDAPLVLRLHNDPQMWQWVWAFMRHCTHKRNSEATRNMLKLSLFSKECFATLRQEITCDFSHQATGTLHLYKKQQRLDDAARHASYQKQFGCDYTVLSSKQALAKEPALTSSEESIAGALFFPQDESGDVHAFTQGLAKQCHNVDFRYNTAIKNILCDKGKITGVTTDKGIIKADSYVMALGADSPLLLKDLGINIPLYPMKGYSVSVPTDGYEAAPSMCVTDETHKIVVSRLGNIVRVAGTAEFAGYDSSVSPERVRIVLNAAKQLFPHGGDYNNATSWACLRPAIPDGSPVLGKTPYSNLFLNTGHGSLGWTLSAASAYILSDIIEGKAPSIDLTGLTLDRFKK